MSFVEPCTLPAKIWNIWSALWKHSYLNSNLWGRDLPQPQTSIVSLQCNSRLQFYERQMQLGDREYILRNVRNTFFEYPQTFQGPMFQ